MATRVTRSTPANWLIYYGRGFFQPVYHGENGVGLLRELAREPSHADRRYDAGNEPY